MSNDSVRFATASPSSEGDRAVNTIVELLRYTITDMQNQIASIQNPVMFHEFVSFIMHQIDNATGELRDRAAELGVRIENANEEQRKRRIAAEARNGIFDELNDMDLPPPIRQTLLLLKGLDERFDTIDRLREELTAFHTGYNNILNDITGLVRRHDEGQYEETYRNLLKDMADLVQHRDDKRVEEMQDIKKDIATIVHKEVRAALDIAMSTPRKLRKVSRDADLRGTSKSLHQRSASMDGLKNLKNKAHSRMPSLSGMLTTAKRFSLQRKGSDETVVQGPGTAGPVAATRAATATGARPADVRLSLEE